MIVDIDPDKMTLGDFEFLEKQSGLSFEQIGAGTVNTTALLALICIQERRSNPSYTMDDARMIPFGEIEIVGTPANPPAPKRRAKAAS